MIKELYQNQEQCRQYGKNAREYAEEYLSKDKAIARYIEIMENTISD